MKLSLDKKIAGQNSSPSGRTQEIAGKLGTIENNDSESRKKIQP
jgi:hypothetical protein